MRLGKKKKSRKEKRIEENMSDAYINKTKGRP